MRSMKMLLFSLLILGILATAAAAQNAGPNTVQLADASHASTLFGNVSSSSGAQSFPGSAARVDFSSFVNRGQYGGSASSDDIRSEIMLQLDGWFTRDSLKSGIPHISTDSAGFNIGYRYHFAPWVAAEANYDYGRIANKYTSGGASLNVQSQIHGITGNVVVGPRNATGLRPFALAGGGVLIFSPTNNAGGFVPGNSRQTRGVFDFGAGLDFGLTHMIALRIEYRGFVYKVPDFGLATLHTDKTTLSSVPSAGVIISF